MRLLLLGKVPEVSLSAEACPLSLTASGVGRQRWCRKYPHCQCVFEPRLGGLALRTCSRMSGERCRGVGLVEERMDPLRLRAWMRSLVVIVLILPYERMKTGGSCFFQIAR
jgi:hypothetical protein